MRLVCCNVMPRRSVETSVVGVLDQALAGGQCGGFAAVGDAELAEDVADVLAGGGGADEELLGDFRIGQPRDIALDRARETFLPGSVEILCCG
jgi:hypothetical protein